jgi:hypothetical protein
MTVATLPLPTEPRALQSVARTLLDQAPATGLPLIVGGAWIADPLWQWWGDALRERGLDRAAFGRIVTEYGNELRLWVVGERPWDHYAGGLAGRVERRLALAPTPEPKPEAACSWSAALGRVGVAPDDAMATLVTRIGELHLLHDIAAPGDANLRSSGGAATAVVWAGARPRDPEVPFGEGRAATSAGALAEALGRFLVKDPAYPPR